MIGIDLDNTIVCYDECFGRVAVETGLVPPEAATSKMAVRDHLRATGREDRWTELQGTIYGPRMSEAPPFPGVLEFLERCRAAGLSVAIVSHRTRFPHLGERHDLHAAAREWLVRHGFHAADGLALPEDRVFFEETKEAKLVRVAALGCTHFIDDLPEVLSHPLFPARVRRILFDPHGRHEAPVGIDVAPSWTRIAALVASGLGPPTPRSEPPAGRPEPHPEVPSPASVRPLCVAAGLPPATMVERLPGGGNNRVYRVETASGPALLKEYFRHPSDPRDRLGAEQAFSHFAWEHGIRNLPRPLACDRGCGLALHAFVPGRKLAPGEPTAAHVAEAAAFLAALNRHRHDPDAAALPTASEACFSLQEHLSCIGRRLARLAGIERESTLHRQAADMVARRLGPLWERTRAAVEAAAGTSSGRPLPAAARVISPSDFGFHNCIATAAGLTFIDFEYAGWDDPAKTVCDFFCQPAVPVPREHFGLFLATVAASVEGCGGPEEAVALRERVALLLPAYELKWCCIMLNEFLPAGDHRRAFASTDERQEAVLAGQLGKMSAVLARLEAPSPP